MIVILNCNLEHEFTGRLVFSLEVESNKSDDIKRFVADAVVHGAEVDPLGTKIENSYGTYSAIFRGKLRFYIQGEGYTDITEFITKIKANPQYYDKYSDNELVSDADFFKIKTNSKSCTKEIKHKKDNTNERMFEMDFEDLEQR